ncbi:ankyrin repeat domain-containing protein [Leifsonia sp. 2TAF2]|uniref:ankyrin repeat domain-containing protein n=1 Tax=Leifsonia sp. 2TAF2 TaxID=3233009 RepID=UPI003F966A1F
MASQGSQWGLYAEDTRQGVGYWLRQGAPLNGLARIEYDDDIAHWETPLLTACVDGRSHAVEALLAHGADPDAANAIVFPGKQVLNHTALHTVCQRGLVDVAKRLIAAGADVNRRTTLGTTPLHFGAGKDHVELVQLLLNAGADPKAREFDTERPGQWGGTPMDQAGPRTRPLFGPIGVGLREVAAAGLTLVEEPPVSERAIDPESLAPLLHKLERSQPQTTLVLVARNVDGRRASVMTPDELREQLGNDFPADEEHGAVERMCQVGIEALRRREAFEYAVAAYRAPNHWEIFHGWYEEGKLWLGSQEFSWADQLPHQLARELEAQLPSLRAVAHVTADESRSGITLRKAHARDQLREALQSLERYYEEVGDEERLNPIRDELEPMWVESFPLRRG